MTPKGDMVTPHRPVHVNMLMHSPGEVFLFHVCYVIYDMVWYGVKEEVGFYVAFNSTYVISRQDGHPEQGRSSLHFTNSPKSLSVAEAP